MKARPNKLLYLNCERQGHQDRSLDHVCVEVGCARHELVCSSCIKELHTNHRVLLLGEFLAKLDDLNFNKQRPAISAGSQKLKSL